MSFLQKKNVKRYRKTKLINQKYFTVKSLGKKSLGKKFVNIS